MNIGKLKRSTQIAIMTGAGSGAVEKTASGTSPLTLSDSVAGNIHSITVKGHSEVVSDAIKSIGDNGFTITTNNKNLFTGLRVGVSINAITGEFATWNVAASSDYIPVQAGYYTLSGLISGLTTLICFYNASKQKTNLITTVDTTKTIYNDGTFEYIAISQYQSENIASLVASAHIQLEKGQTATAYVPNNPTTATITTGLPLRSVSDSIFDTLDNEKVTKKCAEVDLGDLTWNYQTGDNPYFYANTPTDSAPITATGLDVICNNYTTYKGNWSGFISLDKVVMVNKDISSTKLITIRDTSYTDTATFTTAVTGVKLVYPLTTPTETPLTSAETTALEALKTYDPTTVISITDNPSITVKYMGKRAARTAPKKRTNRKKKS